MMTDNDPRRASIRVILLQEWDPIGVVALGGPEHEYDRYIEGFCAMLMDPPRSQDEIAAHLLDIQSRRMGLRVTAAAIERCNRAARSLAAMRMEF
jgi:hypothetical protein